MRTHKKAVDMDLDKDKIFSWGQSTIFAVKREGGRWYRTAIIIQFRSNIDVLMPVCIEALKREGWAWVEPDQLED